MIKANSISFAIHLLVLILFFLFTAYISYLTNVFQVLKDNDAPYIVFAVLAAIAYFFTGFFIGSICRIWEAGIRNAIAVCIVALIGLALWISTYVYSNHAGTVYDSLEWLFFCFFFMPFVSVANSLTEGLTPQYLLVLISFIPTLLMWAGIEYKASILRSVHRHG